MTNKTVKLDLIDALENRGEYFKRVNDTEYRVRCPYCGDSMKNYNTGHLYLKINPDDNKPVQFYCFRCNEGGVLKDELLGLLGIDDINLKSGIHTLNKTCDKEDRKSIIEGDDTLYFDYILPEPKRGRKTEYIERRLGIQLSDEELMNTKIITSLKDFLATNKLKNTSVDPFIFNMLEKDYVGFLSAGNSHVLLRDTSEVWRNKKNGSYFKRLKDGKYQHYFKNGITSGKTTDQSYIKWGVSKGLLEADTEHERRWIKYTITEKSQKNRVYYTMASEIDILTSGEITINMGEGILDVLSAAFNLGYDKENTLNLCVGGKYYERMILHVVSLGLVGSNVTLNIFADNDSEFNEKAGNTQTTLEYYKELFKRYKYLFGSINIYYNTIGKDIGVPLDQIKLKRYKL